MIDREFDVRAYDQGFRDGMASSAAEIERLRAEVQVWINHTKTAVWSDSEECKFLTEENAKLRAYALKAFTVVEFCCGEGLLLSYPHYDCDDLIMEGVDLLKVESSEEARATLGGEQ